MTLSVVTASFNAEKFLQDCLASVREQECSPLSVEHIVIDGASTDGTVDLLKAWQNQSILNQQHVPMGIGRVACPEDSPQGAITDRKEIDCESSPQGERNESTGSEQGHHQSTNIPHGVPAAFRFLSEPDQGQSDAFNKGVSMATGDWICWLNADDLLAPGAVAAFQKALKKHPDADVIYGHVQFITEDSKPAWTCYHLPFFYPLLLNGCYTPPSSGTFFRRDLLLREPLDVDYHYVMDVEWFLRCGRNLRAVCVDQTLSQFRISAEAKTSEMIRSGRVTDRHALERETYRRKYVYSQWPHLTEDQARARFERRRKLFLLLYKALKMRYAFRYLKQRGSL